VTSPTPIRVLMTADTVGGVWTYACELVRALVPYPVEVTLATMGAPPSPSQARTLAALPNVELIASHYALEWMPDPWRDVDAAGDWLLDLARQKRADLVHLNSYVHASLPFEVPVVVVAHACVTTWFAAVHGSEPPPIWAEYRRRVAAGLGAACEVVAPTRAILRSVLAAYEILRDGLVIANGCDPRAWRPARKEPFVLAAGRLWDNARGLTDLDACASVVSWPIHVAGPTTGPAGVGRIETRSVRLLGELDRDELAGWMGRASIFALPARYEPFGLSAVEAALSGAALVLGGIDSLQEVWGDTALYVPPRDPDSLAYTLEGLAADTLRRRALAASARQRALALGPGPMADAYARLYARACRPLGIRTEPTTTREPAA
jgi:glycogen synthase